VAKHADIEDAWKKVQDAMDRAHRNFPQTVLEPELDRDLFDQDAVLLSLSGSDDRLFLFDSAKDLKDRLLSVSAVKKVELVASPGEQLTITLPDAKSRSIGLSFSQLIQQLKAGNASIPSGYIRIGDRKVNVLTNSFFKSPDELKGFPISLKSGEVVTLGAIAKIERTTLLPQAEAMYFNGNQAVGIGVVPEKGVNLQQFGRDIRFEIERFKKTQAISASSLQISEINFQPEYVNHRIEEITKKLVLAVILVGGALILLRGLRVGLIVAVQVPIVTLIAFGFFSISGGVLHQISLVAFILAIGLLVDNVVVMVDGVQDKLDHGMSPRDAAEKTIKEYWLPLAAGTMTTIAAFIPILLAQGGPSDFVRSIGEVAAIALLCSYFFCIFMTPIVSAWVLKKGSSRQWRFVEPMGIRLGSIVANYPKIILLCAAVLVGFAGFGFTFIEKQFFPLADRNQLIVDMQLPEGTHFKATLEQAKKVEEFLSKNKSVTAVSTFVGRGVPLFYYNLPRQPNAPHIAQLIVQTVDAKAATLLKKEVEGSISKLVPFGTVIVKAIAQGPPVKAPIEVRIMSHNPDKLLSVSENALKIIRLVEGVAHTRSDLGIGSINLKYEVNDSANANFGLTRADISGVILSRTRGLPVTEYRGDRDAYQVVVKSDRGEESTPELIAKAYVGQTRTHDISVDTVSGQAFELLPSVINYRNRMPTVTILSELGHGSAENVVAARVSAALTQLQKDPDVTVEMGGAATEAADANKSIFIALPVGIFLLLLSLMFEFNSFRKVGIILITIPLCAVGTVPGLMLSGSSFGFMTLLGCLALSGTVIHNGIFLLDFIDHKIREGDSIDQAIVEGISRRTRPIILTAVATIVELLPLTVTKATLWPPFAWAIISGLAISTLLTLLVVPAMYKLAFSKSVKKVDKEGSSMMTGALTSVLPFMLLLIPLVSRGAGGSEVTVMNLSKVIEASATGLDASAAEADANSAAHLEDASFKGIYLPKLGASVEYNSRDKDLNLGTPFGDLKQGDKQFWQGGIELSQPLFDPAMLYQHPAVRKNVEAQKLKSNRSVKDAQFEAVGLYLQIEELRAKRKALEDFVTNLTRRRTEIQRLLELGRVGESDYLKIKLGIDDAQEGIRVFKAKEIFLGNLLSRFVGVNSIVSPESLGDELPNVQIETSNSIDNREDLQALRKQIEASELKANASRAEALPKLDAFVRYTQTTQNLLVESNWTMAGVRLTWIAFDGGARYEKASAATFEKSAAESRLRSAEIAINAQVLDAREMLKQKEMEFTVRRASIKEATRAVHLESSRFEKGRSSVNDLLDAEEILRDRKEKLALSRVAWFQEWFRLQSALGVSPRSPGGNP
jgi:multidrug efflux pump subunit AcrB/outer membrane protein TolC